MFKTGLFCGVIAIGISSLCGVESHSAVVGNGMDGTVGQAVKNRTTDFTGDGKADIIARDTHGELYMYAGSGKSAPDTFKTRVEVGVGWNKYNNIVAGDFDGDGKADLLAKSIDGNFWFIKGANSDAAKPTFQSPIKVGHSWNIYGTLVSGDFDGDGRCDVIGRDSNGDIWEYAKFTGAKDNGFAPRVKVGHGWSIYNNLSAGDFDGDGKADLLARDLDGAVWSYRGTGTANERAFSGRKKASNAWNNYSVILNADVDGDGKSDLVMRDTGGNLILRLNIGVKKDIPQYQGDKKIGTLFNQYNFMAIA